VALVGGTDAVYEQRRCVSTRNIQRRVVLSVAGRGSCLCGGRLIVQQAVFLCVGRGSMWSGSGVSSVHGGSGCVEQRHWRVGSERTAIDALKMIRVGGPS
jgi:hypothetical protein